MALIARPLRVMKARDTAPRGNAGRSGVLGLKPRGSASKPGAGGSEPRGMAWRHGTWGPHVQAEAWGPVRSPRSAGNLRAWELGSPPAPGVRLEAWKPGAGGSFEPIRELILSNMDSKRATADCKRVSRTSGVSRASGEPVVRTSEAEAARDRPPAVCRGTPRGSPARWGTPRGSPVSR